MAAWMRGSKLAIPCSPDEASVTFWRGLIRTVRLPFLLEGVGLFALGAGIAHYLGISLDLGLYFGGQIWVTAAQIGALSLQAYFHLAQQPGRMLSDNPLLTTRLLLLLSAAFHFTVVATITVALLANGRASPPTLVLMLVMFLTAVFYSAPPLRLEFSGYGAFVVTVGVVIITPAFAFLLQGGELLRLMAMSTFPLACLRLALALVAEFPLYAEELRNAADNRRTMLVHMGWERGMILHNLLCLTAFILLALAVAFGMPLLVASPAFLLLPVAAWQIFRMTRIANGAQPQWRSMILTSAALYGAMVYLLTFGYWIR